MQLFFSARSGCSSCHQGFNFSGDVRYAGKAEVTPRLVSNGVTTGKFRVPTLRNIALTAPYMHDGSVGTLREVVDRYAVARQLSLNDVERADLIAFLESLTDTEFVNDARFAAP
jgi:cytochrome c peroxidase